MLARVLLLALLPLACVHQEAIVPEPGKPGKAEAPMMVEPSAASSEQKAAVPSDRPPNEQKSTAEQQAAPKAAPQPATAPKLADASGLDVEKFHRAEAKRGEGDIQAMRAALLELLRDHPTSPYVQRAYLMLGEVAFEQGDMKLSLQLFEKAAMFPDDHHGAYAQLRTAWCRVNLDEHAEALGTFIKAADRARRVQTDAGEALVRACVLDSVQAYARVGELTGATSFYKKVTAGSGVQLDEVLRRLATTVLVADRRDELARVCKSEGMPAWCAGPLDSQGAARPLAKSG